MKVVIIADISGSVDRGKLNRLLFPTMEALERALCEVWVVFADTQVRGVFRPRHLRRDGFDYRLNVLGGGGTDMQSVRHEVQDSMKPDFMVTISDGYY
jgi:predicted metal-dependent peptidase